VHGPPSYRARRGSCPTLYPALLIAQRRRCLCSVV